MADAEPPSPPEVAGDAALLTLVQWLSPAFPLGGFAYSHGLEWAIAEGELRDAAGLEAWLAHILTQGAGWADAVILSLALRPGADPVTLADLARALAASAERAHETEAQGAALARSVAALTGRPVEAAPLPVVLGVAAAPLGLPTERVIALFLQGFATNLTLAAVRFVPLGQTEGQRVLDRLRPLILATSARAAGAGEADIATALPRGDLIAMRHETMDVRIFRT